MNQPRPVSPDLALAEALVPAVIAAGHAILTVRAAGHSVERKADASPVTEADHAAEAIILRALAEVAPGVPVVAEEACASGLVPAVDREFFLVDPLDGTKEFVNGGDDFTVNVGLIRDGVPVVGLVLAPASRKLYAGVAESGAWTGEIVEGRIASRREIRVREPGPALDVVASKSHRTPETDAYIARYPVNDLVSAGSSLKFCTVAEGNADLYPRMGTTMQWDTAAGDAVLRVAGGKVVTLNGAPLPYGPNGEAGVAAFRNPWFIAAGPVRLVS